MIHRTAPKIQTDEERMKDFCKICRRQDIMKNGVKTVLAIPILTVAVFVAVFFYETAQGIYLNLF